MLEETESESEEVVVKKTTKKAKVTTPVNKK